MILGRDFQILGARVVRDLSPYIVVLWLLATISFSRSLGFVFAVNISFIKEKLRLLIVSNVSIAYLLILSMFRVVVIEFSSKVS